MLFLLPRDPQETLSEQMQWSRAVQILIGGHAIRSSGRLRGERRIKLPTQAASAYRLLA
jgi:hypothetical protein